MVHISIKSIVWGGEATEIKSDILFKSMVTLGKKEVERYLYIKYNYT